MGFMQKQVYFGQYFSVDTTEGTEIVPVDDIGRTVSTHVEALLNYLQGNPLNDDELCEVQEGWLGRMTAPGYTDCTEWSVYRSEAEAVAELEDMFGDE